MIRVLAVLPLLAAAPAPAEPPEFEPMAERFADAAGCRAFLVRLVAEARQAGFDAAEGPYGVAPGDVRAHTVRAVGSGHGIAEYRCEDARLAARRWTRAMAGGSAEDFTVESAARSAPWLKH